MSYVLVDAATGTFLETYDPDFVAPPPNPSYPSGSATTTSDVHKALRFPTATAALEAYRAQSTTVPVRPDGRPNRPLAGRTMEVVRVDD